MHSRKFFESDLEAVDLKISESNTEISSADVQTADTTSVSSAVRADPRLAPDENCVDCKKSYRDPEPEKLIMYLHPLSYKVMYLSMSACSSI